MKPMTQDGCIDDDLAAALIGSREALADGVRQASLKHSSQCQRCARLIGELAALEYRRDHSNVSDPLAGVEFGRYLTIAELGRGASGLVYRARDPALGRDVALKVLRQLDARSRDRLKREAHTLASLNHESVVTVHDVGDVDGELFIAMELVAGSNLRAWVEREQPSAAAIADTVLGAGRGLAAIHAAGLVHRDLKPENIMLTPEGRVVIGDLGLAAGDSEQRGAVGTPGFIAPEVCDGGPATACSDQYSFCRVAIDLIGLDPACTAAQLRRAGLSGPVARALARGLDRNPSARHSSVAELLKAARRRPRTPVIVGIALIAAAAAVIIGFSQRVPIAFPECENGEAALASLEAIDANAPATAERLRRYHRQLTALERGACLEREGSDADALRRAACLKDRRLELSAAAEVLSVAKLDAKLDDAVYSLPSPLACVSGGAPAPIPPPRLARAVSLARLELARAAAEISIGDLDSAEARFVDLAGGEAAEHAPIRAAIAYRRAQITFLRGDYPAAAAGFDEAANTAARSGDDRTAAGALSAKLAIPGFDRTRLDESIDRLDALVERLGDRDLEANVNLNVAIADSQGQRYSEAAARLASASAYVLDAFPAGHPRVARIYLALGTLATLRAQPDEAVKYHQLALAANRAAYGENHQSVGISLGGLAAAKQHIVDHVGAAADYQAAAAIFEGLHGADHPLVVRALVSGCDATAQIEPARAQPICARALEIAERIHKGRDLAWVLTAVGKTALLGGQLEAGLAHLERALVLSTGGQPDDAELADIRYFVAMGLLNLGRDFPRAISLLGEVRPVWSAEPRRTRQVQDLDATVVKARALMRRRR